MSSLAQGPRAQWNCCQLRPHAEVLPSDGCDSSGDQVSEPPRPGVGQTTITDTHHQEEEEEGDCKVKTLRERERERERGGGE